MRIPYTIPQVPELDSLPVERRAQVLKCFATSVAARRSIRFLKVSVLLAFVLLFSALSWRGAVGAICFLAAGLSLVAGVVYYRISAARAILALVRAVPGVHSAPTA